MGTFTIPSYHVPSPHPTPNSSPSPHSQPSHRLLLSLASQNDVDQNHSSLVNKVKLAFLAPPQPDLQMDDFGDSRSMMASEDSGFLLEQDDNMLLSHYQKDIKLEALARRAPTKNK